MEQWTIADLEYQLVLRGLNKTRTGDRIRQLNRMWNKELTCLGCQVCGYNKHVELAHIHPVAGFDKNTKLCVVNNPDNVVVLCPNCHFEFDSGILELSQIGLRKG